MRTSAAFRIVALSAQLLARVVFSASVLLITIWMTIIGTQRWRTAQYWQHFPPDFGCDDGVLLDQCTLKNLLYMWLAPTLLAFAALALLVFRSFLQRGGNGHRASAVKQFGSFLVPPRHLWQWWCGGISISDLLIIICWLALQAAWMAAIMGRYQKLVPFFERLTDNPTWLLECQLVAVALGSLLFPNFVLLFYPVTRGSVVLQASGISYPDAIRYHRWLGHAVMVIVTAHSIGFWGVWLFQGKWLKEALQQGDRVNNLAGGVSFIGGLTLWLSSLEVARRASYEVFYKLHHLGFWIFMFAGCCHYWGMFWYFLPGLVLYGVDGVYRIQQALWERSSNTSSTSSSSDRHNEKGGSIKILEAQASPAGSMCWFLLSSNRYATSPTGFVWLCVPKISWHSWHPFEYIAVPDSNGSGAAVLIHIKAYDRWTQQLVNLVAKSGVNFSLKMEGPYPEIPGPVLGHPEVTAAAKVACKNAGANSHHKHHMPDGVVIAAGGVGITAALSVLHELASAGLAATAGLPTLLIWACRYADELEFLAPRLLAAAQALKLNLTVRLYITGNPATHNPKTLPSPFAHVTAAGAACSGTAVDNSSSNSSSSNISSSSSISTKAPVLVTSSLCPVVGLRSFWCQAVHKLAIHMLAFAGTLAAILVVRYYGFVVPDQPWTTGWLGAALVGGISTAILVPGSALLWFTLLVKHFQAAGVSNSKATGATEHKQRKDLEQQQEQQQQLTEPLLGTDGAKTSAAAAAAACPVAAMAAAALAAREFCQLKPSTAAGAVDGIIADKAAHSVWELQIPAAAAATEGTGGSHIGVTAVTTPVETGRPPLIELINSWLAARKQLPNSDGSCGSSSSSGGRLQQQQQYAVYAMGPTKMVADVQLLCDDINQRPGSSVYLDYVQKTHEL
eukprot:GHRR01006134.1.p1 GENE.GHRR01006134.1~~GHRR01006134.1.p1  ORF type:complete len:902 (+),score=349.32 GHRR01006134.1:184-2889(+)